jgi:hypothetical protein
VVEMREVVGMEVRGNGERSARMSVCLNMHICGALSAQHNRSNQVH